ncbi:MAG: hypothetical protein OHK0017_09410 [Patescibacteria group bacterium]
MSSVLILSLVVLAASIGSLVLLYTKSKSTTLRVVMTIVIVVLAVFIEVVGLIIIGGMALGEAVNNEVQKSKDQMSALAPKNADGVNKPVFEQDEVVTGNEYQVKLLKTYKFTDGTSSQFFTKSEYCGVDVEIKNLAKDKISISSLDVQFMKEDSSVVYPTSIFLDDANNKYSLKTYEVEPDKSIVMPASAKCEEKVVEFVVKDNKFRLADVKANDIKFKIAF